MDKNLKTELMAVVAGAVRSAMMGNEERWLTPRELCEQFGFITPTWLKLHGDVLPRVRATVTDANGKKTRTGWAYPRNKIQELIRTNQLDFESPCKYRASGDKALPQQTR